MSTNSENPFASPQITDQAEEVQNELVYQGVYQSLQGLTSTSKFFTWLAILSAVALIGITAYESSFPIPIQNPRAFADTYGIETLRFVSLLFIVVGTGSVLLGLVHGIIFLIWLYLTYKNLYSLNPSKLEYSSGWAVGYYFVPIMNLFRPFQVLREIWRESHPQNIQQMMLKSNSKIITWWLFRLASMFLAQISNAITNTSGADYDSLLVADIVLYFALLADIVSSFYCLWYLTEIFELQEERHALVSKSVQE